MINAKVKVDLSPAENLKKSLVNKIIKKAVKEAMKPTQQAVKSNAANYKRYGFLTKSIGNKVKTYKSGVVAVIGPKSKYVQTVNGRRFRPAYYEHFLEKGTIRTVKRPILAPAMSSTKQQYMNKVASLIERGISEELNKKSS